MPEKAILGISHEHFWEEHARIQPSIGIKYPSVAIMNKKLWINVKHRKLCILARLAIWLLLSQIGFQRGNYHDLMDNLNFFALSYCKNSAKSSAGRSCWCISNTLVGWYYRLKTLERSWTYENYLPVTKKNLPTDAWKMSELEEILIF